MAFLARRESMRKTGLKTTERGGYAVIVSVRATGIPQEDCIPRRGCIMGLPEFDSGL
jgi:hypothetical protein